MSLSVLIAQHRRTEHSLRESEERFRNMADTAPVMIVTADARQKATFFQQGMDEFYRTHAGTGDWQGLD